MIGFPPFVYCSPRFFFLHVELIMKKFMLGCRFSFEAYARNVRENATKCYLKTTEVLLDSDGHYLSLIFINVQ